MTELERLIKINERLLFILGASLPLVMDWNNESPRQQKLRHWVLTAIDRVVYEESDLPELPK